MSKETHIENSAATELKDIVVRLSEDDKRIFFAYYENRNNENATAKKTERSIKTVQYHLKRIRQLLGLDPREYTNTLRIYEALLETED